MKDERPAMTDAEALAWLRAEYPKDPQPPGPCPPLCGEAEAVRAIKAAVAGLRAMKDGETKG